MSQLWEQIRQLRGRPGALATFSIGVAVVWLVLIGIIGTLIVSDSDTTDVTAADDDDLGFLDEADEDAGDEFGRPDDGAPAPDGTTTSTETTSPPLDGTADGTAGADAGTAPADGATDDGDETTTSTAPQDGGSPGATPSTTAAPAPSGDTTGVSDTEIKIGLHAPETFSGVPLNLAEDPLKGVETYVEVINANGGIHGRKIVLDIQDDRFDSEGARRAANTLINDHENFMVSGTLGIDQIAIVAAEAAKRGVPYTAAGGNENEPIPGMFQLSANYTTHVLQLADYMAKDPKYKGKRVGILVSDSQYIRPVAADFKERLEANGNPVSTVVANQKPAQNPDYNGYILEFRRTNTEVLVPLTDPLTTQQIVQRCAGGAACGWTYSFSNFAHDSDTALALMAPTWGQQRVRGLSAACYYMAPEVDDPSKCARMHVARDQYVAARGQEAWEDEGSGAAFGYQIVSFIEGALTAPGADLTRERFVGALRAYNGYSDLISGPITFAGSDNIMRGATKMAVWEAQPNNRFKMISGGLLAGF